MFVLTITIFPNPVNIPFFQVAKNIKWIYSISNTITTLTQFKIKIEEYTPNEYKPFMIVEVVPVNILTELETRLNRINNIEELVNIYYNTLYVEGIVNNSVYSIQIDNFTMSDWIVVLLF
jgi:hypothetical protein